MRRLPCGCIPGEFLCPEAERLWAQGNAFWELWKRTKAPSDLAQYYIALIRYSEHVGAEELIPHYREQLEKIKI